MKIGIIGSGIVARTLGSGFIKHGYEVMLGTRDISKLGEWQLNSEKGKVGSFYETARFGNLVVLAVAGRVAEEVLSGLEPVLSGKVVIDTTNPIDSGEPENGVLPYFTTMDESLMERLQGKFFEMRFVKAWNSIGNTYMVNPEFTTKPSMFICGDDDKAKEMVSEILVQFGFEVEDMGSSKAAGAIESLCVLWCIPGFLKGKWNHAFKLLRE